MKNPALTAFVSELGTELVFGQVWIRRVDRAFEFRHVADKDSDPGKLRLLRESELRTLAQFTAVGMFRPLKSAPNLRSGWRAIARDEETLGAALSQLYPGAVADWFAARSPQPPITSYRDFTARQTGMYRITTKLDDEAAGATVRACCHKDFCMKRRLWSVGALRPDAAAEKSILPCLEPCAILLEFARKIARLEQEEAGQAPLSPADVERRRTQAEAALAHPDPSIPESDFDSPNNPRRLRFILERRLGRGTSTTGKI